MNLSDLKNVYFIGIGGIGMSAIARYFNSKQIKVSGYDKTETELTKKLVKEGIDIHYTDSPEIIPKDADLIVITPAIPTELSELQFVRGSGITVMKRAEVLGLISRSTKAIAVAGTHGKTTTSAMITHVLKQGGVDVSAFLGGILSGYETNYFEGKSEWVVLEADEYDRSFLHLKPQIAVINSVDADHLDIYGSHESVKKSFVEFANGTKEGGLILLSEAVLSDLDGEEVEKLRAKYEVLLFGFSNVCDVKIVITGFDGPWTIFKVDGLFNSELEFKLRMPGKHNISNALVSIIIGSRLGLSPESMMVGLADFEGIKRRFEWIHMGEKVYIDDYAHHPTELKAAIEAVRSVFPGKKVLGIFQPHLYSRTRDFETGFAEVLSTLDEVILMDIYPAREKPIEGVTSQKVLSLMKHENASIKNDEEIFKTIEKQDFDVVLTLGAGDIDLLVPKIKSILIKNELD